MPFNSGLKAFIWLTAEKSVKLTSVRSEIKVICWVVKSFCLCLHSYNGLAGILSVRGLAQNQFGLPRFPQCSSNKVSSVSGLAGTRTGRHIVTDASWELWYGERLDWCRSDQELQIRIFVSWAIRKFLSVSKILKMAQWSSPWSASHTASGNFEQTFYLRSRLLQRDKTQTW